MKNSVRYAKPDDHRRQQEQLRHRVEVVQREVCSSLNHFRIGMAIVNTIAMPEKMAPATKYGGKIVVCQPGTSAIAKSKDTTECTESTSGVANAARNRYARVKCRHSRSELRQPSERIEKILPPRDRRAVARHRDVGDEADEEETRRDREVRRDREHVPHERRLEVRPEVAASSETESASRTSTAARCG